MIIERNEGMEFDTAHRFLSSVVDWAGLAIEGIGLLVIVLGIILGLLLYIREMAQNFEIAYRNLRRRLGRGILLGLELLVAADILRTLRSIRPSIRHSFLG